MNKALFFYMIFTLIAHNCSSYGQLLHQKLTCLETLQQCKQVDIPHDIQKKIQACLSTSHQSHQIPLFSIYPELKKHIAYISLGTYPSPLERLNITSNLYGYSIYIKRDDITNLEKKQGDYFGGNKVRKLEFLLADALHQQTKNVYTFGCIGSNHVCATAFFCKKLGLGCTAFLTPQPVTKRVQRNFEFIKQHCTDHPLYQTDQQRRAAVSHQYIQQAQNNTFPMLFLLVDRNL